MCRGGPGLFLHDRAGVTSPPPHPPEELETAPTGTVEPTTEYSEISKQFFPARNLKLTTVELFI